MASGSAVTDSTKKLRWIAVGLTGLVLVACGESSDGSAGDTAPPTQEIEPDTTLPPLPIERVGDVESLPDRYPETWFLVHDVSFFGMSDGRVNIVDAAAGTLPEQMKGMFNVSFIGSVLEARNRSEIYASETFYSRGTRGDRTDVLTIWDRASLEPIAEVVWPEAKRFQGLPVAHAMGLLDNERFLGVFNLTPAGSVTVIDLATRSIVSEIAVPGCIHVYPTGPRGFSSLCGDGRFLTTQLTESGTILEQSRGDAFFNSDTSPIYERAAMIDGMAYFPSFDGLMYPVDLSGVVAQPGTPWSMVTEAERADDWRPGGLGLIDADTNGRIYVLMHPGGVDGSQQGGGPEVWVFDPASQQRVLRIPLQEWGLSIALSRGEEPLLMVTNPVTMSLEIYDASSGDYLRTLEGMFGVTPLKMYGAR